MNKHDTQIENLSQSAFAALAAKRDELAKWKDEQMIVESQWDAQAVGKELGLPLGTDIRKNILPAIRRLKRERDELREENSLLKKAPLRQKCQQLERDVDHWCDMHTVACKERGELREELARLQNMAASVADVVAKRNAMLGAIVEASVKIADCSGRASDATLQMHADDHAKGVVDDIWLWSEEALAKLKPFLP